MRTRKSVLTLLLLFVAILFYTPAAGKKWLACFGTYTGKKSEGIYVARFNPAMGKLKQPWQSIELGSLVSVVFAPAR